MLSRRGPRKTFLYTKKREVGGGRWNEKTKKERTPTKAHTHGRTNE